MPFYDYINPLLLSKALEQDEETNRYKQPDAFTRAVLESPDAETIDIGGTPFPVAPNVFSLPDRVIQSNQGSGGNFPSYDPARMSALDTSLASRRAALSQGTEQLARTIETADPTAPPLQPMRDTLRSRTQTMMNAPRTASYDPHEEGWKGQLKHIGEALLLGINNSRNPRTGEVDPLSAGIAATMTSLFGGKGVHGEIARQYIQPRLDEKNVRERTALQQDTSAFQNLSKSYPDTAENRVRAAQARLSGTATEIGALEKERGEQLNLGIRTEDRLQKKEDAETAYQRAENLAKINALLRGGSGGAANARGAMSFTQKFADDVGKASSDILNHLSSARSDYAKADAADQAKHLDPDKQAQAKAEANSLRAGAKVSMERARELAYSKARDINMLYGNVVTVTEFTNKNTGEVTDVKIEPLPNAPEAVREFYKKQVPESGGVDLSSLSKIEDAIKRSRQRR